MYRHYINCSQYDRSIQIFADLCKARYGRPSTKSHHNIFVYSFCWRYSLRVFNVASPQARKRDNGLLLPSNKLISRFLNSLPDWRRRLSIWVRRFASATMNPVLWRCRYMGVRLAAMPSDIVDADDGKKLLINSMSVLLCAESPDSDMRLDRFDMTDAGMWTMTSDANTGDWFCGLASVCSAIAITSLLSIGSTLMAMSASGVLLFVLGCGTGGGWLLIMRRTTDNAVAECMGFSTFALMWLLFSVGNEFTGVGAGAGAAGAAADAVAVLTGSPISIRYWCMSASVRLASRLKLYATFSWMMHRSQSIFGSLERSLICVLRAGVAILIFCNSKHMIWYNKKHSIGNCYLI